MSRDLHRRVTAFLHEELPSEWNTPPLAPGFQMGAATAPDGITSFRVALGGDWPRPDGPMIYGKEEPPHPVVVSLWEMAVAAPGVFLVAQVVGVRIVRVHGFEDPGVGLAALHGGVLGWYEVHRPGVEPLPARESRLRARMEEAAKLERVTAEAEAKRAEEVARLARIESERTAWKVTRGHRVRKDPGTP